MMQPPIYLLPIVEIDRANESVIQKHRKPRTVESGRHDEERTRLHLMREELGLTLYEIVEITRLSYGTVLYSFWSGRSKEPVNEKISSLIENTYREMKTPENSARRQRLTRMTLREIVDEWSRILGASDSATEDERNLAVAHALGLHYLTIQRQTEEKRDRWGDVRIFVYDRRIQDKAKEFAILRIPFAALAEGSKYDRKGSTTPP
jgi:hypothetical protein